MKFLDMIVEWWLRRCPHHGDHVAADILEGSLADGRVRYCRRCGAVSIAYGNPQISLSEWRRPRPRWYPQKGGEK